MQHYLSTLENSFKKLWNKPSLCNYKGEVFTCGDVAKNIVKFGILFEEAGIEKGDKIAICAKNTARWAVSFLSINVYRATAVSILCDFHPDSVKHLVDHSDSKILFIDRLQVALICPWA